MITSNPVPNPNELANMNLADLREAKVDVITATVSQMGEILLELDRIHAGQMVSDKLVEQTYNTIHQKTEHFLTLVYISLEVSLAAYRESRRILEGIKKEKVTK
jgi:hypothetical protein